MVGTDCADIPSPRARQRQALSPLFSVELSFVIASDYAGVATTFGVVDPAQGTPAPPGHRATLISDLLFPTGHRVFTSAVTFELSDDEQL